VRVVIAAAALAVLVAAAGCGGSGPSKAARRQAVTQYINGVNVVERDLRAPLLQIESTYRSFSAHGALQSAVPRFARAETTLHTLHARLAKIDAPPDAQQLRGRLLRFVDAEAELAHELTLLAAFLPRFSTVLQPLAPADKQLQKALAAVPVPKPTSVPKAQLKAARAAYQSAVAAAAADQAAALETYVGEIEKVQDGLRRLHPPPAMAPAYRTQLLTLTRVAGTGKALVTALRAKKYAQVAMLDRQFQKAATTSTSLSAQREQIAAVKAYNARVRAVDALAVGVDNERVRLQKTLG
jgi:hypothetical protein